MRRVTGPALIVFACLSVAAAAARVQRGFEDPVPRTTVDAAISPMVYQGGTVVLRVRVNADGSVAAIDPVKPVPALTEPVVAAVRQWQFTPARRNGVVTAATTTVAVQIVLVRTGSDR
jgi:TonB family protein